MSTADNATKYVQVVVSTETHKQLKILAMDKDVSLQDLLRTHLEEWIITQQGGNTNG